MMLDHEELPDDRVAADVRALLHRQLKVFAPPGGEEYATRAAMRAPAGDRGTLLAEMLAVPVQDTPVVAHDRVTQPHLSDHEQFLRQLLATPVLAPTTWHEPVALRPAIARQRVVLERYRSSTRVDGVLRYTQHALLAGALGLGVYWFADGVLHDWMAKQAASAAAAASQPAVGMATNRVQPGDAPRQNQGEPAAAAAQQEVPAAPVTSTGAARQLLQALATASFPEPEVVPPAPLPARITYSVVVPKHNLVPVHLRIPSIGVDTPVKNVYVRDDDWEVAEYAAGYMVGTGLPSQPGNVGISGHAGLRGGVFLKLPALQPGADVFVYSGGWRHVYRVRGSQTVWPTQIEVLDPTDRPTLTLLTCTNWDTQRLVVTADFVGSEPVAGN
jgi:sortase A